MVVFYCWGNVLRWNVAQYIQPRCGVSKSAQCVRTALERLLGPVALCGPILAITCAICWSDIGLYSKIGGGYLLAGTW